MRYLLILLIFSSCQTTYRAEAYLAKKGVLPSICADKFPSLDTLYQKDTIVKTDTLLTQEYIIDTTRINDTLIITKEKPVYIKQVKTLTKVEVRVNRGRERQYESRISSLEAKLATLESDKAKYKELAKTRLNWLIWLLVAVFGFSVRKPVWEIIKWNLRIS